MTHVLIVEDHEENRNLLKMLLVANGYRVTAAGDGLEALAAARRDPPDAVVSDVLMPKMDGFALCRAWMQDAALRSVPFIFYSATYIRPDDVQFAMALGAVRYLIKPLEAEVFLGELRAVLQRWAGQDALTPAAPLDDTAAHALHESALARKLDDKVAQLEAANRKLQESEARFRAIASHTLDHVLMQDRDLRYSFVVNPQLGLTEADMIDKTDRDILEPEDAEKLTTVKRKVLETGEPVQLETSLQNSKGQTEFFDGAYIPKFDWTGKVDGLIGHFRNVTERKRAEQALHQSEARYRELFGGIKSGVAVYMVWQNGEDFVFTDLNPAGEQHDKITKQEVVGRRVTEVFPGVVEFGLLDVFRRVWKTGQPEHHPVSFYHDKRVTGWRENYVYRLASGEVVAVYDDITERKRADDALRRSSKRMRDLSQRLIEVEDGVRRKMNRELHDRAGASLSALNLNLSILRSQLPLESLRAVGTRLDDTQKLLEETTMQVRDVMADLHPPALDDYGLLAALRTYVESIEARLVVPISVLGEPFVPRLPLAAETALFRVAQGALVNAVIHAQAKRIEILLAASPGRVALTIADDGVGFDVAHVSDTHSSWGIVIMRERAEAVGAELTVESTPGQGTRVCVEISREKR